MSKEVLALHPDERRSTGEVEVPQAAVVTDYSDAIVIDQEAQKPKLNRRNAVSGAVGATWPHIASCYVGFRLHH